MDSFFNAEIVEQPFRHLFAERVFEEGLYKDMLKHLPQGKEWMAHGAANRSYLPFKGDGFARLWKERKLFWLQVSSWLCSQDMMGRALDKFGIKKGCHLKPSLVRQHPGYSLGPHTDDPSKVLTLLFYLPSAENDVSSGTVIYRPKQAGFSCRGDRHHAFRDFQRLKTIPFLPNSVFAFEKSSISFHGVEPVTKTRDVLQYNINGNL